MEDDDDVVVVAEKTLEEVLKDRYDAAKARGDVVELESPVPPGTLALAAHPVARSDVSRGSQNPTPPMPGASPRLPGSPPAMGQSDPLVTGPASWQLPEGPYARPGWDGLANKPSGGPVDPDDVNPVAERPAPGRPLSRQDRVLEASTVSALAAQLRAMDVKMGRSVVEDGSVRPLPFPLVRSKAVSTLKIMGLEILFPFPQALPAQIKVMVAVLRSLQGYPSRKGEATLVESPTGTGKTVALLCAALAWQRREMERGGSPKIVYGTRTHSQVKTVIRELERTAYRPSMTFLGSRERMCLNPVARASGGASLSGCCRDYTRAMERSRREGKALGEPVLGKTPCVWYGNLAKSSYAAQLHQRVQADPSGGSATSGRGAGVLDIEDLALHCSGGVPPAPLDGEPASQSPSSDTDEITEDVLLGPMDVGDLDGADLTARQAADTADGWELVVVIPQLGKHEHGRPPKQTTSLVRTGDVIIAASHGLGQPTDVKALLEAMPVATMGAHARVPLKEAAGVIGQNVLLVVRRRLVGCPYFTAKALAEDAQLVICPYNYIIDPGVKAGLNINLDNAVVIIDEAHNIEDTCREAGSGAIDLFTLLEVAKSVRRYDAHGDRSTARAAESLNTLLGPLCTALSRRRSLFERSASGAPSQAQRQLQEREKFRIPPEERRLLHRWPINGTTQAFAELLGPAFTGVENLKRTVDSIVETLSDNMREDTGFIASSQQALESMMTFLRCLSICAEHPDASVVILTCWYNGGCSHPRKAPDLDNVPPDWRCDGSAHEWGFELGVWLLSPAPMMTPVVDDCHALVLTSGTLSPMDAMQYELGPSFQQRMSKTARVVSANHVVGAEQLLVRVVHTSPPGPTSLSLNCVASSLQQPGFLLELGRTVLNLVAATPPSSGVIVFVPSYSIARRMQQVHRLPASNDVGGGGLFAPGNIARRKDSPLRPCRPARCGPTCWITATTSRGWRRRPYGARGVLRERASVRPPILPTLLTRGAPPVQGIPAAAQGRSARGALRRREPSWGRPRPGRHRRALSPGGG